QSAYVWSAPKASDERNDLLVLELSWPFWGDLGQSRTAPKSSARLRYIERPHQSLEPTAGRSDDQFTTLLRSPTAQRSSRCRPDFRCAAIRSAVVWRAERNQQCSWLREVFQPLTGCCD